MRTLSLPLLIITSTLCCIPTAICGPTILHPMVPGLVFGQPATPVIPYVSPYMRTVLDDATAAAARSTLGLTIGTNVQAYDPNLTLFSALTAGAGYIPYWTSTTAMGTIASTAWSRTLIDDATGAAGLATLTVDTNWIPMITHGETDANRITWKGDVHLDHVYDVRDYGTLVSDGNTDCYAAFNAAEAAADNSGGVVYVPDGNYAVDWDFPISANVVFYFEPNAIITIPTGHYIQFHDPTCVQGARKQHFNCVGTGNVQWSIPGVVYPEWWGAVPVDFATVPTHDDGPAINAALHSLKMTGALATGSGVFELSSGRYGILTTINMQSGHRGTIVRGQGRGDRGTVLYSLKTDGSDVFQVTGTTIDHGETGVYWCSLEDFLIYGTGTDGDGLDIRGFYNGFMSNVVSNYCGGNGFYTTSSWVGTYSNLRGEYNGLAGWYQTGNVGNQITGGEFANNTGAGIVDVNGSMYLTNVTIEYNTGNAIEVTGGASLKMVGSYVETGKIVIGDNVDWIQDVTILATDLYQIEFMGKCRNYWIDGGQATLANWLVLPSDPNTVTGDVGHVLARTLFSVGDGYSAFDVTGPALASNLIPNGDFRIHTSLSGANPGPCTGWTFSNAGASVFTLVTDTVDGVSTTCVNAASTEAPGVTGGRIYFDAITADANEIITVTYWVKMTSGYLYLYSNNDGTIIPSSAGWTDPNTGGYWQRRTWQTKVPADGTLTVSWFVKGTNSYRLANVMVTKGSVIRPFIPQVRESQLTWNNADANFPADINAVKATFTGSVVATTLDSSFADVNAVKATFTGSVVATSADSSFADVNIAGDIRATTARYARYYHINLYSSNPGASGATFVVPDANRTGGWDLDAASEYLYGEVDIHSDWSGDSNATLECRFVNNTAGTDAGDTVDIKVIFYYKGLGEDTVKTQTVEVATTIGVCDAYKAFKVNLPLDWDLAGNVLEAGDIVGLRVNIETDTSECDDITLSSMTLYYLKTHVGIEDGDV